MLLRRIRQLIRCGCILLWDAPRLGTAILLGVYKGTLPCADCEGLDTVLRLYTKGKFDSPMRFMCGRRLIAAAPHGDVTYLGSRRVDVAAWGCD